MKLFEVKSSDRSLIMKRPHHYSFKDDILNEISMKRLICV